MHNVMMLPVGIGPLHCYRTRPIAAFLAANPEPKRMTIKATVVDTLAFIDIARLMSSEELGLIERLAA